MCTCDKPYHRVWFIASLLPCGSYELSVLNGVNSFLKTFKFLIGICTRREQPEAGSVPITVCHAEQGTSTEREENDLILCYHLSTQCPVTGRCHAQAQWPGGRERGGSLLFQEQSRWLAPGSVPSKKSREEPKFSLASPRPTSLQAR